MSNTNEIEKIKLIFVLPNLSSGGAERVMSFVATNISTEIFDVSIWIAGRAKNTAYNVTTVRVSYFNKSRVLNAIPNFFFSLVKERPDIVISSISHLNTAMALLSVFFPKTKFIGREANVLSVLKKHNKKSSKLGGLISPSKSYKYLDLVLCQSKDMYEDMKLNYNIAQEKLKIINNPMTDSFELKSSSFKNDGVIQFITVARLKRQKGHKRIINALSKVKFRYHYTIVGDGPEKQNLINQINDLGIEHNITHIPFTNEVSKFLSKSDFFLQGSFVEGFPNCLIESCSVGTPVLAYEAPGGLNEIIDIGINGLVSKDDDDFLTNIHKAIYEYDWRPKNIRDSVQKKFNKEKIIRQYEDLFLELLNRKH